MCLGDRHQVSMGPPEGGLEFAELTDFPPELLLADPENVTYDKLELKNTGPIATFFDPRVGRWLHWCHYKSYILPCTARPKSSTYVPAADVNSAL